ncbi:MAG: GIY-YIG nuclease family protein [Candidatus Nanoarchaeia archaeon]|nr:GIY-YIG nuclease family protein [Candidatus Nanoarchaeia archaeon]
MILFNENHQKKRFFYRNKEAYLQAKEHTPNYHVYIVECQDGSYYTGFTEDLIKRITEHKMGNGAKYTQRNGFKRLVYFESHSEKEQALKREKEIKEAGKVYKKIIITEFQKNLLLL